MEALDRMAQIIREDLSITVRDLARQMGFLETRSVYYWLDKGRFDGLKQFKRAVLSRRESRAIRAERVAEGPQEAPTSTEDSATVMKIPVARGVTSNGDPIWADQYIRAVIPSEVSQSTFAILEGAPGASGLQPGQTWLVVDPQVPVRDRAHVLLLRKDGTITTARAMCFGSFRRFTLSSGEEANHDPLVVGTLIARLEFMPR